MMRLKIILISILSVPLKINFEVYIPIPILLIKQDLQAHFEQCQPLLHRYFNQLTNLTYIEDEGNFL